MAYEHVSPTQVSIFLGNQWLDDACTIEYAEVTGREAYYGFQDYYFRTVVPSRHIVTGALTIQFRYLGYLTKAIKAGQTGRSVTPDMAQELMHIRDANLMGVATPENYETWIEDTLKSAYGRDNAMSKRQALNVLGGYLQNKYWGNDPGDHWLTGGGILTMDKALDPEFLRSMALGSPVNPDEKHGKVNIQVRYGPEGMKSHPERVEQIEDVHFTADSKRIDNSRAEISGAPIQERYEFIAKKIVPLGGYGKVLAKV